IPRRAIVGKIRQRLTDTRRKPQLGVTLLTGAGGEGKSTALLQVVCDMVNAEPAWNIVWREDPGERLPKDELFRLKSYKGWWLIASDDAEAIARDVEMVVKALRSEKRT